VAGMVFRHLFLGILTPYPAGNPRALAENDIPKLSYLWRQGDRGPHL